MNSSTSGYTTECPKIVDFKFLEKKSIGIQPAVQRNPVEHLPWIFFVKIANGF